MWEWSSPRMGKMRRVGGGPSGPPAWTYPASPVERDFAPIHSNSILPSFPPIDHGDGPAWPPRAGVRTLLGAAAGVPGEVPSGERVVRATHGARSAVVPHRSSGRAARAGSGAGSRTGRPRTAGALSRMLAAGLGPCSQLRPLQGREAAGNGLPDVAGEPRVGEQVEVGLGGTSRNRPAVSRGRDASGRVP